MEALQRSLLERILGYLTRYKDTVRASAISRSWHDAAASLHPRCMSVPDGAWPMDEHAVYSTIRWLQSQQQNQRFDHLNSLHINMESRIGSLFTDSCCELLLPEKLFQSMLVTASLWPLQTCELTGYLDITSIAMLLPDRLQHLRICPDDDCFPDVVSLSLFARFTQLKTLCIVSLCQSMRFQKMLLQQLFCSTTHFLA